MSLWNDLGFTDNPYSPKPIAPDETGARVGRDVEVGRLVEYLRSAHTHPTIEGPNGVGKTSLVAVAGYRLFDAFSSGHSQQAILPLREPFQLSADDNPAIFKRRVLLSIAQGLIEHRDLLKGRGFDVPDTGALNNWINSPIIRGWSGGVSILGTGASAATGAAANSSIGFTELGFENEVKKWLRECLPTLAAGAFICVIDNLELLDTSRAARALLEALRDEVLNLPGIRWVLCGARGIMRSVASSPRLQGVLADPLVLMPIPENDIGTLIKTRIDTFKMGEDANAPVDVQGFIHVYAIGNSNLRNAMKYSEDFSFWAVANKSLPLASSEKLAMIEAWMAETAATYQQDTSGVGPTAWRVFDQMASVGGGISPSEFADFGFESSQAMRPHLRSLEEANLIESAIDETDNRRKTISITSRGWIVRYSRSGFQRPSSATEA